MANIVRACPAYTKKCPNYYQPYNNTKTVVGILPVGKRKRLPLFVVYLSASKFFLMCSECRSEYLVTWPSLKKWNSGKVARASAALLKQTDD